MQEPWNDESFARALSGLPAQAGEAGQRPDAFWREQRLGISARIERAPAPHAGVRWGLALAGLLLVATMLNQPAPQFDTQAAPSDPDHELMLAVQQAVRRPIPEALAPAELLVAEMNSALSAQGNP